MKVMKFFMKMFDGLVDRIFAVLGAVGAAQLPGFMQHYVQRLGGHIDELQRVVNEYAEAAQKVNLTLEQYIKSLEVLKKIEVSQMADVIKRQVIRLADMTETLEAITSTSVWKKPFVFMHNADWSIASRTWENYVPNVPTDLEGLAYAFTGMIITVLVYQTIRLLTVKSAEALKEPETKPKPKRGRRDSD